MKKRANFFVIPLFILLWLYSLSWATEDKKLSLFLRDGWVSAEIHNAPLVEVTNEIGKRWGILIEFYGGIDKDRLVSAKFEHLPPLDSLYRLLRGINFIYIEGEKLCLLGFTENLLKNEVVQVMDSPYSSQAISAPSLTSEKKREELQKSTPMGMFPDEREEGKRINWASFRKIGGEYSQSGEVRTLGEIDHSEGSKGIGTSFTTPIILDAKGQAISALSNDIIYDPNLLANPRVIIDDSATKAEKEVIFNEVKPGLLRLGIVGLNQNVIPDGTIAYVTFDVLKKDQVSLRGQPTASDPQGKMISVIFRNGKIIATK
jgi:hypothetical protein